MVQSANLRLTIACVAAALLAVSPLAAQPGRVTVRVAAASDLRFALEEVSTAFRRISPGINLVVTYGSSGNFHAQVVQGAPYDVLLSADRSYVDDLVRRGKAEQTGTFTYAFGRLVLWVHAASALDVTRGLAVLRDPSVRRIAIANPAHAPYGRAAEAAMKTAGILAQVQRKLVLGDSVTQAAQFVESGAADIGLIAQSLAIAPAMRHRGRSWNVPEAMHPTLEQAGVLLARGDVLPAARQFREFLRGPEGRTILSRYGFGLPAGSR